MKWIREFIKTPAPIILSEDQIRCISTGKLLEFLQTGNISRNTGNRIVTEILLRFYEKLGEWG